MTPKSTSTLYMRLPFHHDKNIILKRLSFVFLLTFHFFATCETGYKYDSLQNFMPFRCHFLVARSFTLILSDHNFGQCEWLLKYQISWRKKGIPSKTILCKSIIRIYDLKWPVIGTWPWQVIVKNYYKTDSCQRIAIKTLKTKSIMKHPFFFISYEG